MNILIAKPISPATGFNPFDLTLNACDASDRCPEEEDRMAHQTMPSIPKSKKPKSTGKKLKMLTTATGEEPTKNSKLHQRLIASRNVQGGFNRIQS